MPKSIQHPRLKQLCGAYNYSVRDLSLVCNCSRDSILRYIKGRKSPRLEQKLAALFNLTVAELRTALGINQNQPGDHQ